LNGGIQSAHEAWLVLRGLRTLPTRLRQQEADALTIAHTLREHPALPGCITRCSAADAAARRASVSRILRDLLVHAGA
jgi:O-acetylhomoserine/O-acetylserine sulfhydrylase-like pyridoxal-dependent enzyme